MATVLGEYLSMGTLMVIVGAICMQQWTWLTRPQPSVVSMKYDSSIHKIEPIIPNSNPTTLYYHTISLSSPNVRETLYACRQDDDIPLNNIELRAIERLHMYLWILQIRLDKMYCPRRFIRYFMEMSSISDHPSGDTMFYLLLCTRIQYGAVIEGISKSVQDLGPILQRKYFNDPMSEYKTLLYENMDPRANVWFNHGRNSIEYKNITSNYTDESFFTTIEHYQKLYESALWTYVDNYIIQLRNFAEIFNKGPTWKNVIDGLLLKLKSVIVYDIDKILESWLKPFLDAKKLNWRLEIKYTEKHENELVSLIQASSKNGKPYYLRFSVKLETSMMTEILQAHGYSKDNFIDYYSYYDDRYHFFMDMYLEDKTQVNSENVLINFASRICNGVHDPTQFQTHEERLMRTHMVLRAFTRYFS